jgi:predicted nucleic acid-binding protein
MIDALVDTNIMIYTVKGDSSCADCMRQFHSFGMSALSLIELFAGAHDSEEGLIIFELLETCEIIPIDKSIALATGKILREKRQKSTRSTLFADIVIACTALHLGVPLVTNNPKDFQQFEGLKLISP